MASVVRLCLPVMLLLGAGQAAAAQFFAVEDACNGRQLMIQGVIEAGDHERFLRHMAELTDPADLPAVQNPDVLWTVKLDSPGGDPGAAMAIGRFLRQALATTEVGYRYAKRPDGVYDFARSEEQVCLEGSGRMGGCARDLIEAECAGACLLIWMGGAERYALEGRLGRHGLAGAGDVVQRYLVEMGLARDDAAALLAAESRPNEWLSWVERDALSGPTRTLESLLAECPARLSADESFRSVAGESAAVRNELMDRAQAHRQCRLQRLSDARARSAAWLAGQAR